MFSALWEPSLHSFTHCPQLPSQQHWIAPRLLWPEKSKLSTTRPFIESVPTPKFQKKFNGPKRVLLEMWTCVFSHHKQTCVYQALPLTWFRETLTALIPTVIWQGQRWTRLDTLEESSSYWRSQQLPRRNCKGRGEVSPSSSVWFPKNNSKEMRLAFKQTCH